MGGGLKSYGPQNVINVRFGTTGGSSQCRQIPARLFQGIQKSAVGIQNPKRPERPDHTAVPLSRII
ncbi:MAG TPA: hypothetical protein DD856_16175 [Sulfobacillus sp.]|nr:hypothetical protein [Sulfobacillus sp.]